MLFLLIALVDARMAQADPVASTQVPLSSAGAQAQLLRALLPLGPPADALQVLRGPPRAQGVVRAPRAGAVIMQNQNYDNDMSGWKPPGGGGGGDFHGGDGFSSTDTPDFLPEKGSEAAKAYEAISFTDGMQGSQADPNRKKSTGPELAGALDSDPDIYEAEMEDLDATRDGIEFVLPSSGMTDMDFDMRCDSAGKCKDITIDVRPVAMTYEDFYVGFTAESHPAFRVTPINGKMEKRKGPPTQITVSCSPPPGLAEPIVGYLCFILPEEKAFSTYYKITCST
jgi:hypothetical protein